MTTTTAPNPYQIFIDLKQAGWFRNFNTSQEGKGHLFVPVPGAPKVGGGDADRFWAGAWTRQDGTTLFQRSNMDRSVTTIVIDPMGNVIHSFKDDSLAASSDHLSTLNLI
jgi:hypothetical protein